MTKGRGKAFEAAFSKSLKAEFGESCFRIPDGDSRSKIQMPGDFIAYGALTWLIECKSTEEASFPFRNVQPHQVATLLRWQDSEAKRMSLIAIHYAKFGRMFLFPIESYVEEGVRLTEAGRKSMPIDSAEKVGIECRKEGGVWKLGMP